MAFLLSGLEMPLKQKTLLVEQGFEFGRCRGLLATAWLALRPLLTQRSLTTLESNLLPPEVLILVDS